MKVFKNHCVNISLIISILFIFNNCDKVNNEGVEGVEDEVPKFYDNYDVTRHFDRESNTWYYLTRIKNKDQNGHVIRLRHAISNRQEGETVRTFAIRSNSVIAINASMGLDDLPPNTRQAAGIQIVNGKIIQELKTTYPRYTLGIKGNNEIVSYPPGTTAAQMLRDGAVDALTVFIPLILNHEKVSEDITKLVGNSAVKHPRQVVAQYDNLDLLILSCGGRGYDGDGMTAEDLMRILKNLDVRIALNLDGGGSTSTVIEGNLITKKIDSYGTKERLRPNFLYVKENKFD